MVEKEKERLIKEHAIHLEGFLHPDLVQKAKLIANYQSTPNQNNYSQMFQLWFSMFQLWYFIFLPLLSINFNFIYNLYLWTRTISLDPNPKSPQIFLNFYIKIFRVSSQNYYQP